MILRATDDPAVAWEEAERYVTGGSRTYSPFSQILEVDRAYHPEYGDSSFALESFWIQGGSGVYRKGNLPSRLHDIYHRDDRFLFVVHPQIAAMPDLFARDILQSSQRGPRVEVIPSANARTVFVKRIGQEDVPPHFLKLHFPRRISRFLRTLELRDIDHQLWTTSRLHQCGICVLPDVGGAVVGMQNHKRWGFLLRESVPVNCTTRFRFTLPLFALYSSDVRNPHEPLLLRQLLEGAAFGGAELLESIVRGLVGNWISALSNAGCFLESHGQNSLLLFSLPLENCTIAYRDTDVYVDASNLAPPTCGLPLAKGIGKDKELPREQLMSLTYDTFLGHHLLSYLGRAAADSLGLKQSYLSDMTRSVFKEFGGRSLHLPGTTYRLANKLTSNSTIRLVNTSEKPEWR
jgi:hypothetical protein